MCNSIFNSVEVGIYRILMGYVGFFYVEAKSFEILFEFCVGDGIRLAEWSKGLFRAMFLSKASVEWFRKSMEELRQGREIQDFCRTFRVGSMVHILQWRGNAHGRFLELYEYGNGGRRMFVILPEGRDGCGWANCLAQFRKLENYEKKAVGGKRVGKLPIALTMVMKSTNYDS
jgi:hypothetical protein